MTANVTDDIYAARHEGQAAVQAADVAVHRGYHNGIIGALETSMLLGNFTSEDVRRRAEQHERRNGRTFDAAPNLLPAIIGGYASAGRIREVGRVTSTRPERRGSKISLWRAAS